MTLIIPHAYKNLLGSVENTEKAIKSVKDMFQSNLSAQLALLRVTAPMVVLSGTGINDDLNGVERPVRFPVRGMQERPAEVVHSLAKWKRLKLAEMHVAPGRGIYTDMNALRPDEDLDNLHSIYVDQWDWEKVIREEDRNLAFLQRTVRRIYEAIKVTENKLYVEFPQLVPELPDEIFFIHSEELLRRYPGLTPKERENAIVREKKAVFIIGIGGVLSDGTVHDGRAADYDDWSTPNEAGYAGLNGDILLWNSIRPPWSASLPCAVRNGKRSSCSTASSFRVRCRPASAAVSVSPGSACSCSARPISGRSSPASGRRTCGHAVTRPGSNWSKRVPVPAWHRRL